MTMTKDYDNFRNQEYLSFSDYGSQIEVFKYPEGVYLEILVSRGENDPYAEYQELSGAMHITGKEFEALKEFILSGQ